VRIRDLGSSNGTFVNGRRVKEAKATTGDRLTIGPITFEIYVSGAPGRQQMQVEDGFVVAESEPAGAPRPDAEPLEFQADQAAGGRKGKRGGVPAPPADEDEPLPIFFDLDEGQVADEAEDSAEDHSGGSARS